MFWVDEEVSHNNVIGLQIPVNGSVPAGFLKGANRKAMLAAMDADALSRLKKRMRLTGFTENSIQSWEKLEQELLRIRKTGLAYDHA